MLHLLIALDNNNNVYCSANNNNIIFFKFKQEVTGQRRNGSTKNIEITIPLKYLGSSWRTLEMPLINFEISLQVKWSKDFFFSCWYCSKSSASVYNN